MNHHLSGALALLFGMLSSTAFADKISGPPVGQATPALQVHSAVPDTTGKVIDIVAQREGKPTIYFVVPAPRFSRPTARLLKTLDEKINAVHSDAKIIAVWFSEDVDASREYLPRVQTSLKLNDTQWTVYNGPATGPATWNVDTDADATVVISHNGKVISSTGYVSPNETLTDGVLNTLRTALPAP